MGERLSKFLVRYWTPLLFLACGVACISFPLSRKLNLDWQVEGMFADGDPLVDSYRRLQEHFGGKDICLVVYRDPELWDPSGAGLERLEHVSQRLSGVEGVKAVLSLAELHATLSKLRDPIPLLNIRANSIPPILNPDDKLAQALTRVFEGYTHRRESPYVAIACLLNPTTEDAQRQRGPSNHEHTLARLAEQLTDLPAPAVEGFVTGEPVLVAEGFRMVERDGWRLGLVSSLLVSLVLLACFRSLRWTMIPLLVVHWSLLVTQALLVLLQLELSMISSTLTAIVTVIGVATTMHLLFKFQQMRRAGCSREQALENSLAALLAPIFWACLTDAVGFSALIASGVGPVRDFGFMMALGSLVVFLAIILLVPGLTLIGKFDVDPSTPKLDFVVRLWLRRILDVCLKNRRAGVAILTGLLVLGGLGSTLIQVETDFTKNFHPSSPIVHGFSIIERELGGAGVWDILLPAPERIDQPYIDQVVELEETLRNIRVPSDGEDVRLTKVLSIADAVQATGTGMVLSALPISARLAGMQAAMPEFTGALLTSRADTSGHRWLRIMLRSREQVASATKSQLIAAVERELDQFTRKSAWTSLFQGKPPRSEVAGYHVMLGQLVSSVLADQWKCFSLATLGIAMVLVFATRSWVLGLAALVTNAMPIVLVLGTLGGLGFKANMGVAMISAVSLGLSVDSSIHYLLHYRRRITQGDRAIKSLRSAQENVGLAAAVATIALIAGFISMCTSEFVPTVVFGSLASITMLGSLVGNLVMLPLLIAPRN